MLSFFKSKKQQKNETPKQKKLDLKRVNKIQNKHLYMKLRSLYYKD